MLPAAPDSSGIAAPAVSPTETVQLSPSDHRALSVDGYVALGCVRRYSSDPRFVFARRRAGGIEVIGLRTQALWDLHGLSELRADHGYWSRLYPSTRGNVAVSRAAWALVAACQARGEIAAEMLPEAQRPRPAGRPLGSKGRK